MGSCCARTDRGRVYAGQAARLRRLPPNMRSSGSVAAAARQRAAPGAIAGKSRRALKRLLSCAEGLTARALGNGWWAWCWERAA
jgi:hypothetical protein